MKTVLITGACGFIGSNFVHWLLANTDCRIVCLDAMTYAANRFHVPVDERVRLVEGDIRRGL